MADTKPKKPAANKKIIDVKPGGDGSSGTSRAIIVNNRPILKDPMMAEINDLVNGKTPEESTAEESSNDSSTAITVKRPAKIEPLSDEEVDTKDPQTTVKADDDRGDSKTDTANEKPAEATAMTDKKVATNPNPAPNSDSDGDATNESDNKEIKESKEETSSAPEQDSVGKQTAAVNKPKTIEPLTETPPEEADTKNTDDAEPVTAEVNTPSTSEEAGESPEDDSLLPGRSTFAAANEPAAGTDAASDELQLGKDGKPKKSNSPTGGDLTPEQQKAVETGEYFLPIRTAESRRVRKELIGAVLFVLILIVIWLDIMLDAGLLRIGNLKPLTNFF